MTVMIFSAMATPPLRVREASVKRLAMPCRRAIFVRESRSRLSLWIYRHWESAKIAFNNGSEAVTNSPEEFRKFMLADMAKWADVVKRSGAEF